MIAKINESDVNRLVGLITERENDGDDDNDRYDNFTSSILSVFRKNEITTKSFDIGNSQNLVYEITTNSDEKSTIIEFKHNNPNSKFMLTITNKQYFVNLKDNKGPMIQIITPTPLPEKDSGIAERLQRYIFEMDCQK